MQLDTTMSVDLDNVERFIESDNFIQFLLNNTTDFATAAFILQTVKNAVTEARE